jgi:copper(I)-binding protein
LLLLAVLALLGTGRSWAQVTVSNAWVRGTVGPQTTTGAFMDIRSTESVTLVAVATPIARIADVHETTMKDGVMRMRPIAKLDVAAGQTVTLKPGSYHVMLQDLKRPLKNGETVPLSLTFEGRDKKRVTIETTAQVRDLATAAAAPMGRPQ